MLWNKDALIEKIMNKLIKYLDLLLAPIVLISLFYIKVNPIAWLFYALACFVYIFVNWEKGLLGQATLNLVAGLIAVKNFLI